MTQAYGDRPVTGAERLHLRYPVAVVGQQTVNQVFVVSDELESLGPPADFLGVEDIAQPLGEDQR